MWCRSSWFCAGAVPKRSIALAQPANLLGVLAQGFGATSATYPTKDGFTAKAAGQFVDHWKKLR
jgi:hypothetical protein